MSTGSSTTSYPPVSNGTGPDSIVLQVSENAWANGGSNADAHGDAEFTVAVNGVQQGGTYTALAPHGTADQTFTLNGTFGANPTLAVAFINDAYGGSPQADRNLYVDSISYDGANQNQSREIRSDGTVTFDLTGAGNDGSGSSGSGPAGPVTSLHYAANANFATGSYNAAGDPGSDGFNLADVGSAAAADSLPSGVKGLVWLGDTSGVTTSFMNTVNAAADDPNVYGFYVADEPADNTIANLKAEDAYIALHAPGKMSFIIAENDGSPQNPSYALTPSNTGANLIGLDPYPVRPQFSGGMNLSVIDAGVHEAEAMGWALSQIIPVYQAFGGGGYSSWTLPTATQEQQILGEWGKLTPKPAFDYAYSWGTQDGDSALGNTPSLQAVFAQHNAT